MGIGRFPLVAENRDQQYQRDIDAGEGGGDSRAFEAQPRRAPIAGNWLLMYGNWGAPATGSSCTAIEAQPRRAPIAVHEEPVAGEVEQVGADHGEGDGLDDVHRLKVAAEGAVEEEGRHAAEQRADEGA